ncbi:MAG: hypothetical protein CL534_16145 [Ahrensia sp.]|nr:hypothetical protein [Ahrensia sp.]
MSWLSDAIQAQTNNIGAAMTSTPHRQKIIELRAAYNNALADVRGDASLSELGRTQMIARAWTNTRAEIARLEQLDFDTNVKRYNDIERQVFGTAATSGADAVSFRDATDRADKLDTAEAAMKALGNAELSGDTILAKAVVMRAWQADWGQVVDQYAVTHPTVTDKLAELGALRQTLDGRVSRLGGKVGASLIKPSELQGKMPDEIKRLAEADPSLSMSAVSAARIAGTATPQDEADARAQAVAEARARAARGE